MKLSLLICTLNSRKEFLDKLLRVLEPQLSNEVEVLISNDNGTKSIGTKRNELLRDATGDYIAFIDDDDLVAPNYIELILSAIKDNPDVVGMNLIMTTDGKKAERSYHSIKYREWFELPCPLFGGYKVYFRNPNHLNPVKRELALQIKFPEISMAEDRYYSQNLLPLLKSENYIDQPIYFYLWRNK